MAGAATEGMLRDWRFGSTQAERLVAGLLHLEGYKDVDPQHPLGGPDGLKDVLCTKDGALWVAAAYFPSTAVSFATIRSKFDKDAGGASANRADGFAFFVNQRLSGGQRAKLTASSPAARNEIYHLERLVALLNSAKGSGLRLEYLRIPMAPEEQLAFLRETNAGLLQRLKTAEALAEKRSRGVFGALHRLEARTRAIGEDLAALPSTIGDRPRLASGEPPTSALTIGSICWLHRIVTAGTGVAASHQGQLRRVDDVWIGPEECQPGARKIVPVPASRIRHELNNLISSWQRRHRALKKETAEQIAETLADFHHRFFLIHPFMDGNGRVARLILDQAARELLDRGIGYDFTSPPEDYCETLARAGEGDLGPLRDRILAALE